MKHLIAMWLKKNIMNLFHYSNTSSILLDENKNIIPICDDIFKSKYLSDISFSNNDYILNTLLSLLPEKIEVHLLDNIIDEYYQEYSGVYLKSKKILKTLEG